MDIDPEPEVDIDVDVVDTEVDADAEDEIVVAVIDAAPGGRLPGLVPLTWISWAIRLNPRFDSCSAMGLSYNSTYRKSVTCGSLHLAASGPREWADSDGPRASYGSEHPTNGPFPVLGALCGSIGLCG